MKSKLSRQKLRRDRRRRKIPPFATLLIAFVKAHTHSLQTGLLLLALIALILGIFIQLPPIDPNAPPQDATVIDYSTFLGQVKAGNLQTVTIQGDKLSGTLAHALPGQACDANGNSNLLYMSVPSSTTNDTGCVIYSRLPAQDASAFIPTLLSHHVVIQTHPVQQSFPWIIILLLALAPLLLLLLSSASPLKNSTSFDSFDKRVSQLLSSRVRRFERTPESSNAQSEQKPSPAQAASTYVRQPSHSSVTFDDVAGIDEVRADLTEVAQYLRKPEKFTRLGAYIPRGILLVGPPGTGKTLLAKAVAGEADVPFFSLCASEFVEMFVGVGASRVRNLFKQARESAPCVVFIDEIDAVGRKRSLRLSTSDEREQTLNQLLVELDGFTARQTVIVLAATNRVDMLDAALLRPGRFDRQLTLALPDRRGREAILRVHTRHTPLHATVCLNDLARRTAGMSGADLANLVNEAALSAARQELTSITPECFETALARIQLGAQRALVMSESEKRIIAFHESGHALVAHYLPGTDPVNCITILPRGQHLGITQFAPQEDRYNYNRAELMASIAVKLAGRIAIELAFGSDGVTTGAEDDLQNATALARRMVTHWGMSSKIGVVFADSGVSGSANGAGNLHRPYYSPQSSQSANMAALIDHETERIVQDGFALARSVLIEHHAQLTRLAETLLKVEQLDRKEFEALLARDQP